MSNESTAGTEGNAAGREASELSDALARIATEAAEDDCGQFDDEPDYPKDCFGCYAPGTEDCDWCEFADECAG